jgi:hypothetical protein
MIHAFLIFSKLPFFEVGIKRSYQQKKCEFKFYSSGNGSIYSRLTNQNRDFVMLNLFQYQN